MKVLHGLYQSLPKQSGYSIRSKYILEGQKNIGINSFAVTPPLFIEKQNKNINGVLYYRTTAKFNLLLKIPFIKHIYNMKLFERRVEQIVKEKKIDLIHAHSSFFVAKPMLRVAKKYNIPFTYEIRGLWEDTAVSSGHMKLNGLKYNYYRNQENKVIESADQIITISEGIKRDIKSRKIKSLADIKVIPNGADFDQINGQISGDELIKLRETLKLEGCITLGYISSFTKMEGIQDLIKSIKYLKEYNIKLLLVGDGVELASLKELAKSEGVKDKIVFTGRIPHEKIGLYYSLIDIFIIPRINSRVTNIVTPLKPLEAMAREKAIIASDVGGLKELIKDKYTGLLFKSGNVEDLARKIIYLIEHENIRSKVSKNAYNWVKENRQWNCIINNYKITYEEIMNR